MIRLAFTVLLLIGFLYSPAQLDYTLTYKDSSGSVIKISIQPSTPLPDPISFVMPRSIPGGYGIYTYDSFIEKIYAFDNKSRKISMTKDDNDAPRWYCTDSGQQITRIEYELNLDKMERRMLASDASIIRPGFAGILNYSVFGWIDGTEKQPVQCTIETFEQWPIFSTVKPLASMTKGFFKFNTENYYSLADGQTFIGPAVRVKEFTGLVPVFVASYSQAGDEYLDDYGWQGTTSLAILKDYFGEIPFRQYSIMLRKSIPGEAGNAPSLAMEHLQSCTFFGDTTGTRAMPASKENLFRTILPYLHHIAHAFIPLRCYGATYRPYVMEIPPIIDNIWFNEGFMWFLAYDTLKFERFKIFFSNNVYKTSPLIKKMSLQQLSQTASTMYGTDFRLGKAVFSRGALMATEMNNYIKEKSTGKKSMKDVLRYLYNWSKENKRPFTMEEFAGLINKACGIDLSKIYAKWQLPVE